MLVEASVQTVIRDCREPLGPISGISDCVIVGNIMILGSCNIVTTLK